MKVLLIEDEKAMSDLIAIKFKVEGFEVDQAFNLAEAKTKLLAGGYDAVLSDYLLPDGNSLDMLAEVRSDPKVANVPVIMATNYIEDLSQDKAKELKISEVIVKYQVVPAQMVQKIKALVGGEQPAPVSGQSNSVVPVETGIQQQSGSLVEPGMTSQAVPQPASSSAPPTDSAQGAVPPGATPPQPVPQTPAPAPAAPTPAPVAAPAEANPAPPVTPTDPAKTS